VPAWTDDHEHCWAAFDGEVNCLSEVLTGRDAFDIHEDTLLAHELDEVIADTARVGGRIFTPITDKDLGRGWTPGEDSNVSRRLLVGRLCWFGPAKDLGVITLAELRV
jgi:hypothetical protein